SASSIGVKHRPRERSPAPRAISRPDAVLLIAARMCAFELLRVAGHRRRVAARTENSAHHPAHDLQRRIDNSGQHQADHGQKQNSKNDNAAEEHRRVLSQLLAAEDAIIVRRAWISAASIAPSHARRDLRAAMNAELILRADAPRARWAPPA